MQATFRRLWRSSGCRYSAIKWLFPVWKQAEWKVSSSFGRRTRTEQKSLQRFADPDESRRAKTPSSCTSGTRRHCRAGEEFLVATCWAFPLLQHLFFTLEGLVFVFFPFSAPVWISTGVVRSAFRRSTSKILPAFVYIHPPNQETRRERDVYAAPRDIKPAYRRRRGAQRGWEKQQGRIVLVWCNRQFATISLLDNQNITPTSSQFLSTSDSQCRETQPLSQVMKDFHPELVLYK